MELCILLGDCFGSGLVLGIREGTVNDKNAAGTIFACSGTEVGIIGQMSKVLVKQGKT